MSAGPLAMLAGLFVVPAGLLWLGHRLRRRPPRWRGAFWGALAGHVAAVVLATVAALLPPELWSADDLLRGLLGYAALPLLPVVGGLAGAVAAGGG